MVKPLWPKDMSLAEIKAQLAAHIGACSEEIVHPLSLTTKLACTFKLAMLEGVYQYLNSLDYAGKTKFMRDFRYAQLEASLIKLADHTRREREANNECI